MKKLLLASIIMTGISSFAFAQTPEAVKAKKEFAKKEAANKGTAAPVISTSDNKTAADSKAKVTTDKPVETDDMKAAKIKTTDQESAKPVEKIKVADMKKAAKSAEAKKTKGS